MKNSSYGYYGSTTAVSSFDDDMPGVASSSRYAGGPMSRGMQLEAAVEKLPMWYFDDVDAAENERISSSSAQPGSGGVRLSGGGGTIRSRRSMLYLDESMDLLGSVSEVANPDDDDADDGFGNNGNDDDNNSDDENKYYNSNSSMTRGRSIRSSYLFDSPKPVEFEPQSNSTTTSTLDDGHEFEHDKLSFIVHDHHPDLQPKSKSSNQTTMTNDAAVVLDTSPQSNRGMTPVGRQHRLSSRRSTLSSSCATCTDLVVTRYTMGGREKKVMYHIDVVNHESQLQTYTIRRSYTDFKMLHNDLSAVLEARKDYYLSRAQLRQNAYEPTASTSGKDRRTLSTGTGTSSFMNSTSNNASSYNMNASSHHQLRTQYSSSPEDALEASIMTFTLPTLPHAGLMSFWRRHDHSHLKHRCEVFQELLRAILKMPFLRESFAMQTFLSTAPCAIRDRGSSYVSLCEYSVPTLDLDEEHRERRRRATEHRRNSSVSASHSMYEY